MDKGLSGLMHGMVDGFTKLPTLAHKAVDKVVHVPEAVCTVIHDTVQLAHRGGVELDKQMIRSRYQLEKHLGIAKPVDPTLPGLKEKAADTMHWLGGQALKAGGAAKSLASSGLENGKYALQATFQTVASPLESIENAKQFYPEYAKNAKGIFRVAAGAGAGGTSAAEGFVGLGKMIVNGGVGAWNLGRHIWRGEVSREDVKEAGRRGVDAAGRGLDYLVNDAPTDISNHVSGWVHDPAYNLTKDVVNVGTSLLVMGGATKLAGNGIKFVGAQTAGAAEAVTGQVMATAGRTTALVDAAGGATFRATEGIGNKLSGLWDGVTGLFKSEGRVTGAGLVDEAEALAPEAEAAPASLDVTANSQLGTKPGLPSSPAIDSHPFLGRNFDLLQREMDAYPARTGGFDFTI